MVICLSLYLLIKLLHMLSSGVVFWIVIIAAVYETDVLPVSRDDILILFLYLWMNFRKVNGHRNQLCWWSTGKQCIRSSKNITKQEAETMGGVISVLICSEQTPSHQCSPSAPQPLLLLSSDSVEKPSTYCIWAVASWQRKCNMH